ncbi:MAG: hypothetical protein ACO1QS_08830 [Verrucomicrobiota bacterium]
MDFGPQFLRLIFRLMTAFGLFTWLSRKLFGARITAVAGVTLQATYRFRLFPRCWCSSC